MSIWDFCTLLIEWNRIWQQTKVAQVCTCMHQLVHTFPCMKWTMKFSFVLVNGKTWIVSASVTKYLLLSLLMVCYVKFHCISNLPVQVWWCTLNLLISTVRRCYGLTLCKTHTTWCFIMRYAKKKANLLIHCNKQTTLLTHCNKQTTLLICCNKQITLLIHCDKQTTLLIHCNKQTTLHTCCNIQITLLTYCNKQVTLLTQL